MSRVINELCEIIAKYLHYRCGWRFVKHGQLISDAGLWVENKFEYGCLRYVEYRKRWWFVCDMTGYPPFGRLCYRPACWKNERWVNAQPQPIEEYDPSRHFAESNKLKIEEGNTTIINIPVDFWFKQPKLHFEFRNEYTAK